MELAIAEAERGRGRTSPNPMVGALVVDEAGSAGGAAPVILTSGYHARAGLDHGEAAALRALDGSDKAQGKTLYVTLEPCNHIGRTGKCTDLILGAGIRRVVVGMRDPNPRVTGGGIERLRAAGVEVTVGVLANRCRHLNRGYLRWLTSGRPHLIMKAALSLDGRLGPRPALPHSVGPQWLTSGPARLHTHLLRDRCDAILVGAGTVLADDPQLTVRLPQGYVRPGDQKQPRRVVVDGALRIPASARVCAPGTLVLTSRVAVAESPDHAQALRDRGVELIPLPPPSAPDVAPQAGLSPTSIDLYAALRCLGERDLLLVLCEGGAALHAALLDAGLYDEAAIYLAPLFLGDDGVPLLRHFSVPSVTAAPWIQNPQIEQLGTDVFIGGLLQRGAFAPSPATLDLGVPAPSNTTPQRTEDHDVHRSR